MSFSSDVKHEICQYPLDSAQKRAQLCALLLIRATLNMNSQGMYLSFQTENAAIAKKVFSLLKEEFNAPVQLAVLRKMNLKKNNIYRLTVHQNASGILEELSILRESGLSRTPSYKMIRSDKNARAFLQGCFLGGGSINHPRTTNYHMEICCGNEELAACIQKLMERFDMPARMIERKSTYVVYMKAGDKIADFLRLAGTSSALFNFEDTRIQRDFLNQITRLDNCEVANEMKSQKAGKQQLSWIAILENNPGKVEIPPKIREVMEMRKAHPDASVLELCDEIYKATGQAISKSGMKHRLNRIRELAVEVEKETLSRQESQKKQPSAVRIP